MTDLSELLAKLEAAEEGSRELDAQIYAAICSPDEFDGMAIPAINQYDPLSYIWMAKSGRRYNCWHNMAFTRSINAAIGLIVEKLPGAAWLIGSTGFGDIWNPGHPPAVHVEKRGQPALGLCIALVKALQAKAQAA